MDHRKNEFDGATMDVLNSVCFYVLSFAVLCRIPVVEESR